MKQVYIATYAHGVKAPTRVFASCPEEAAKAAFAAYTFTSCPGYPGPKVSDVVESVELAEDQVMKGGGIQPCVQTDYEPPKWRDVLKEQFPEKKG